MFGKINKIKFGKKYLYCLPGFFYTFNSCVHIIITHTFRVLNYECTMPVLLVYVFVNRMKTINKQIKNLIIKYENIII